MKRFRFLVLLVPLFLSACGLTDQQKADYSRVERSGVNSAVYDKMVHGDPLSIYDIKALGHAGVSDGIILRYLRDQGTTYYLNSEDVSGLRKAGVSQSVVDYMLQTPQMYGPGPDISIGFGYGPYWGPWGPGYYGGYGGYYPYHRWR